MTFPKSLFEQWRVADTLASEAERVLLQASIGYLSKDASAPSEADRSRAVALRSDATRLFNAAMDEVVKNTAAVAWEARQVGSIGTSGNNKNGC